MAAQSLIVALAGNPNVGKSTIFNALTGSQQHVGNWPGKTVEKKEGWTSVDGQEVMIVDLPGTYSLAAYSIEEIIARDFILRDHPGVVVAVVDAGNLERNLYLVSQIIELGTPLVLALNMSDTARNRGLVINTDQLSAALGGIPVIETIGSRGIGLDALRKAIAIAARTVTTPDAPLFTYDERIEAEIIALQECIEANPELAADYPARWLAIKLLENDPDLEARVVAIDPDVVQMAQAAIERVLANTDDDPETFIADRRYAFTSQVTTAAVTRTIQSSETASDRLDRLVMHRIWGLPLFLLLMWIVFQLTANVSAPWVDWIDGIIAGPLSNMVSSLLATLSLSGTWVESILLDGIIAGVGGVLVFVPVLLFLFFAIAVLEDTGYMSRAAFVMDHIMRRIGLHGKSFLPLVIGFGCTVPAIYATRTLENEKDRRLTAFLTTFMSCGARLPVYVVFAAAFFGAQSGTVIFSLYLLGIAVALLTGFVMKRTLFRGEAPHPFVIELPPYRRPNMRTVWTQVWERTRGFIRNATTVIMASSIVIWFLMAVPLNSDNAFSDVPPDESLFASVSGTIAPILAPAGFGTWEASGALISGFVAKEVVIGTMNVVYGASAEEEDTSVPPPTFGEDMGFIAGSLGETLILTGQEIVNIVPRTVNLIPLVNMPEASFIEGGEEDDTSALEATLTQAFTPLAALAFLVFVLLYTPCMTATAAMRHEFNWRWTLTQMIYATSIAWLGAVIVYQGGTLLGLGA